MTTKRPSPKALAEFSLRRLCNGYISDAQARALEAGKIIDRGEITEIFKIGDSMDLKAFMLKNGIDQIKTYDELEAKVALLVERANSLSRKAAFEMVTEWIRHSTKCKAVEATAEFYVALSSTLDETGLDTVTDELLEDNSFAQLLGQNAAYNQNLQLPYQQFKGGRTPEITNERMAFTRILDLERLPEGRHTEAIKGSDYQQAVTVMMIAEKLAEETKRHVGVDIFNLEPIAYTDLPFEKATRYAASIPLQLQNWVRRGLKDLFVLTDYDKDLFLRETDRLRGIAEVVLTEGAKDPFFIAYATAVEATKKKGSTVSDSRAVLVALHALQKKLYTQVESAFDEAKQELHPKVETIARNIGWFVLTPGNGGKVEHKHWRKIHTLKATNGHIDEGNAPSLASSISGLKEIARAEDIDLTSEKNEIAEHLRAELAVKPQLNLNNLADTVLTAYDQKDTVEGSGETNWYINTILFRTSEKFASDGHYDLARRKYAAVHELANFIRHFAAN